MDFFSKEEVIIPLLLDPERKPRIGVKKLQKNISLVLMTLSPFLSPVIMLTACTGSLSPAAKVVGRLN